jgi:hypothetical protein
MCRQFGLGHFFSQRNHFRHFLEEPVLRNGALTVVTGFRRFRRSHAEIPPRRAASMELQALAMRSAINRSIAIAAAPDDSARSISLGMISTNVALLSRVAAAACFEGVFLCRETNRLKQKDRPEAVAGNCSSIRKQGRLLLASEHQVALRRRR